MFQVNTYRYKQQLPTLHRHEHIHKVLRLSQPIRQMVLDTTNKLGSRHVECGALLYSKSVEISRVKSWIVSATTTCSGGVLVEL